MKDKEKIEHVVEEIDRKLLLLEGECTEKGRELINSILYEDIVELKKILKIYK